MEYIEDVEDLALYRPGGLHPVKIGEVLNDRYKIVHKLGFGGFSTIWLARDSNIEQYVAIKILEAEIEDPVEVGITQRLARQGGSSSFTNLSIVLDTFCLTGPNGIHTCLVLDPAAGNLRRLLCGKKFHEQCLPYEQARPIVGQIILAVAELHRRGVVHGDLHPGNVMFRFNQDINALSEEDFYELNGKPKEIETKREDREVITTDQIPKHAVLPMRLPNNLVEEAQSRARILIGDFGEAHLPAETERHYSNTPEAGRPPESRFDPKPLSFSSDIWTLANLIWYVLEGSTLFSDDIPYADLVTEQQVNIFGKLPDQWWQKWEARAQYYDEDGNNKRQDRQPQPLAQYYEDFQDYRLMQKLPVMDDKEKQAYIAMLTSMFVYEPEKRATIEDILESEWVTKWVIPDMIASGIEITAGSPSAATEATTSSTFESLKHISAYGVYLSSYETAQYYWQSTANLLWRWKHKADAFWS